MLPATIAVSRPLPQPCLALIPQRQMHFGFSLTRSSSQCKECDEIAEEAERMSDQLSEDRCRERMSDKLSGPVQRETGKGSE